MKYRRPPHRFSMPVCVTVVSIFGIFDERVAFSDTLPEPCCTTTQLARRQQLKQKKTDSYSIRL